MFKNLIYTFLLIFILIPNISNAEIVNSIKIEGNNRVSSDTIIMFSEIKLGEKFTSNESNRVLKNIYKSNFFSDVKINLSGDKLIVKVKEFPIIQNIFYEGIKANKIKDKVYANLQLKQRSSFNQIFLKEDKRLRNQQQLWLTLHIWDLQIKNFRNRHVNIRLEN